MCASGQHRAVSYLPPKYHAIELLIKCVTSLRMELPHFQRPTQLLLEIKKNHTHRRASRPTRVTFAASHALISTSTTSWRRRRGSRPHWRRLLMPEQGCVRRRGPSVWRHGTSPRRRPSAPATTSARPWTAAATTPVWSTGSARRPTSPRRSDPSRSPARAWCVTHTQISSPTMTPVTSSLTSAEARRRRSACARWPRARRSAKVGRSSFWTSSRRRSGVACVSTEERAGGVFEMWEIGERWWCIWIGYALNAVMRWSALLGIIFDVWTCEYQNQDVEKTTNVGTVVWNAPEILSVP